MKHLITAIIATLACFALSAQTADEFLMLANGAYKKGDFKRAAEYYAEAISNGGNSAELYFNAANADAKIGKKGGALLFYLKSHIKNPRLREAEANLKIFAEDNGIPIPRKTPSELYLTELSQREWIFAATAFFWLAVLAGFAPKMFGVKSQAYTFAAVIFAVFMIVSLVGIAKWRELKWSAVALKDDVALRLSPVANAPIDSTVQEGAIAKIKTAHGNFIYVETPSGKRGWADTAEFAPLYK